MEGGMGVIREWEIRGSGERRQMRRWSWEKGRLGDGKWGI